MKRKIEIEISKKEAILLFDNSEIIYNKLIKNVFCSNCQGSIGNKVTEIIDYKIYLESSNDVIFRGKCAKCNHVVARFIETGENIKTAEKVEQIFEMRKIKLN